MNKLEGLITNVDVSGDLSLVSVRLTERLTMKAIVIDTPETAPYLQIGKAVKIMFKETEVVLGTLVDHRVSLQNRIEGTIAHIEKGRLLSRVRIHTDIGELHAVVSSNAIEQLGFSEQMRVYAMIKLNETMLAE